MEGLATSAGAPGDKKKSGVSGTNPSPSGLSLPLPASESATISFLSVTDFAIIGGLVVVASVIVVTATVVVGNFLVLVAGKEVVVCTPIVVGAIALVDRVVVVVVDVVVFIVSLVASDMVVCVSLFGLVVNVDDEITRSDALALLCV